MSSKTKIVVLHMKEILYTGIFIVLGLLLAFILFFMFGGNKSETVSNDLYQPGVYTSSIKLSNATLEVEVTVDSKNINSVRFSNLDESITTSYPLVQPALEDIALQVYEQQSLENLTFSENNLYTSQVLVDAIETALSKAQLEE